MKFKPCVGKRKNSSNRQPDQLFMQERLVNLLSTTRGLNQPVLADALDRFGELLIHCAGRAEPAAIDIQEK
jgi:hypothetical protein